LPDHELAGPEARDLMVLALPGVQRFISEARTTSDVRSASEIFASFAGIATGVCRDRGELVFPSGSADPEGMPNRVVAHIAAGTGAEVARAIGERIEESWRNWIRSALSPQNGASVPATPGFPILNWVYVPAGAGGYMDQWKEAQRLLAAGRRVRDFPWVEERQRDLCSLTPRWPAVMTPRGLRAHEQDTLSAVGWAKRRWPKIRPQGDGGAGFPSTASIASAPCRRAAMNHLSDSALRLAIHDLTLHARTSSRSHGVMTFARRQLRVASASHVSMRSVSIRCMN
jgi:CRISPR-associated protein Cmr2